MPSWRRGRRIGFPSVTKQGVSAIFQTRGNETCHVILRGGTRTGPNHGPDHVRDICARLLAKGLPEMVMIDCSHGNSEKDYRRQAEVAGSDLSAGRGRLVADLRGACSRAISSKGGRTTFPGRPSVYGQSITDACLSLEQTEPLLERLAKAQQARGTRD